MSEQIEDKYISTFILHALGDTIGFKNGEWEFYEGKEYPTYSFGINLEKLYEFIDLGGINDINLENWRVSDDTLLHMAIGNSLLSDYRNIDQLNEKTVENLIEKFKQMRKEKESRYSGYTTNKYIDKILNGSAWKDFKFDKMAGGNGAAMRCHCIGLAFHGEENRDQLIQYAINSSQMTHPNPIGWLGGLSVALFTAFAIEKIHIYQWPQKMLEIVESNEVKKYIIESVKSTDSNTEQSAYMHFISAWKTYLETRFVEGKPVKTKSQSNVTQRIRYYSLIFEHHFSQPTFLGTSGYDTVIIAYDCLIDAEANWEKLVVYAMLNSLDSDTIGAIAGGFYGAIYGSSGVPKNNLKYLEYYDELKKIGMGIYKKFYLRERI